MAEKAKNRYIKSRGTCYYARLNYKNPDQGYDDKTPNMQLMFIPDNPEEFTDAGVALKEPTDNIPGPNVKIWTKFVEDPLLIKDAKGNKLGHDFVVGNESVVNVLWSPWKYDKGVTATLRGVQIIEHVAWEPDNDFTSEEGFEAEEGDNIPF